MITIEINEAQIQAALRGLEEAVSDLSQVMGDIGEALVVSTKKRFGEGKSPAGAPWAAKSPVTIAAYQARGDKADTRPLFGPSGDLNSTIHYEHGPDFVRVGSSRPYAAMMQFGGTKAAFPNLWGDIPARPFLGLSDDDQEDILATISEALAAALNGD